VGYTVERQTPFQKTRPYTYRIHPWVTLSPIAYHTRRIFPLIEKKNCFSLWRAPISHLDPLQRRRLLVPFVETVIALIVVEGVTSIILNNGALTSGALEPHRHILIWRKIVVQPPSTARYTCKLCFFHTYPLTL